MRCGPRGEKLSLLGSAVWKRRNREIGGDRMKARSFFGRLFDSISQSLYRKVLVSITAVVLLAFLIYIVFYAQTTQREIISDSRREAQTQLTLTLTHVEKQMEMLEVASRILNTNQQLIEIVSNDMDSQPTMVLWTLKTQNLRFLSNVSDIVPDLKFMRVYSEGCVLYEIWPTIYSLNRLSETEVLDELSERDVLWKIGRTNYANADSGSGEYYISRFSNVRYAKSGDRCVIETGMTLDDFLGEDNASLPEVEAAVLLSKNGRLLYDADNPYLAGLLETFDDLPERLTASANESSGTFLLDPDGCHVVTYGYSPELDATVYHILSNSGIRQIAQNARTATILLTLGVAAFLTLVILLILHFFLKKISVLKKYMFSVQNEGIETAPIQLGKDEVGELAVVFNNTVSAVKTLTNIYLKEMEALHRSEIKLLQHQINWHFIYNTLNAIEMHAIVQGDNEIADAIGSFGGLLRYSAGGEQIMVPLCEEVGYIQNFVDLVNVQYDNHLELSVDIPPDLSQLLIPRMLLQPIVENAFVHGLLPLGKDGTVKISAVLESGTLRLILEDNGMGIDASNLQRVNEILQREEEDTDFVGDHIALRNTSNRIKAHYGKKYGVELESDSATYTRVILRIKPLCGEKNEVDHV